MKKLPAIISIAISALILFIPTIYFLFLAFFSNLLFSFIIPVVAIFLTALTGVITYEKSNKISCRKLIISLISLIVFLLLFFFGGYIYKFAYLPNITLRQELNFRTDYEWLTSYRNNFVQLDENDKPSINFSSDDKLPVLDGATALVPVYGAVAKSIYPKNVNPLSYLNFNTTKGSYVNLVKGECDVIFAAEPSEEQKKLAADNGLEYNMTPIGSEAFVFIVNKKNPVSELTINQIRDIYTGKITNWNEVGGKNKEIRLYQRDTNSGSQTAFLNLMGKDVQLKMPETIQIIDVMAGVIDIVADYENHDNSIGYSFRYFVENMRVNINVKMLSINGIEPTRETIRNKTYPITDNFYAITIKGRESENTKRLLDWLVSPQGQRLIEKTGYVSLLGSD